MVTEIATLDVKVGSSPEFEKDFKVASQYLVAIEGYLGHTLKKCLERANRYLLTVEWTSVEAHEVGFRGSENYQKWKALLHHYYDPFPTVEHYVDVT